MKEQIFIQFFFEDAKRYSYTPLHIVS